MPPVRMRLHLGVSLQRRDGSFVVCWGNSERDRIRDSFLKNKLGLLSDSHSWAPSEGRTGPLAGQVCSHERN